MINAVSRQGSKKAQGLSLHVIIIAALALVVLVVLIMIFTGRMGSFTTNLNSCETKGGNCDTIKDRQCPPGSTDLPGFDCEDKNKKCCITLANP